ncbi:uncharacterized protein LOC118486609 [Helianthus annuus]|uniref:uncharacterized protein LOC118486609 n=1 Tax=Helianthus annuus TaxID=4232 RepID=UPI00165326EC|nr:uncharacterized protein LOC118486609 [Helianthus annuus]
MRRPKGRGRGRPKGGGGDGLRAKTARYGAGEEDVAGARPRGAAWEDGRHQGGPHVLVRRKRLNSDGEDGTEGRRRRRTVDKQQSFRDLLRCTDEEERLRMREIYKKAKREAKKAVTEAKNTAYKQMYERLETKEGEHDMFKIAKARERRRQDLGVVKFIKGEDGRVLVKAHDIKLRWQTYFHNLFNDGRAYQQDSSNPRTQRRQQNNCYCKRITQEEVRMALRKMGRGKAVGLDNIPIEVWKCLGEEGVQWLTLLFNHIFKTGKMPDQ